MSRTCDTPGLKEKSGKVEGPGCWSEGLVVAPGLKLKFGRAGERPKPLSMGSLLISRRCIGSSTTDLGRRPIALEKDEPDEEGRAGNVNGGFGGGTLRLGEGCELESCDEEPIGWSRRVGIMMGLVGPFRPPIAALSIVLLVA